MFDDGHYCDDYVALCIKAVGLVFWVLGYIRWVDGFQVGNLSLCKHINQDLLREKILMAWPNVENMDGLANIENMDGLTNIENMACLANIVLF